MKPPAAGLRAALMNMTDNPAFIGHERDKSADGQYGPPPLANQSRRSAGEPSEGSAKFVADPAPTTAVDPSSRERVGPRSALSVQENL